MKRYLTMLLLLITWHFLLSTPVLAQCRDGSCSSGYPTASSGRSGDYPSYGGISKGPAGGHTVTMSSTFSGGTTPTGGIYQGTTYGQVLAPGQKYARGGHQEFRRLGYLTDQTKAGTDRYNTPGGLGRATEDGGDRFANLIAAGQGRSVARFEVSINDEKFTIQGSKVTDSHGRDVTDGFREFVIADGNNTDVKVTSVTFEGGRPISDSPYSADHNSILLRVQGNPQQAVQSGRSSSTTPGSNTGSTDNPAGTDGGSGLFNPYSTGYPSPYNSLLRNQQRQKPPADE
jgi:hypothetical protein